MREILSAVATLVWDVIDAPFGLMAVVSTVAAVVFAFLYFTS